MVCHTNGICPDVSSKVFEIRIAQFACRHLYAYLVRNGVEIGVKMREMNLNVVLLAQFNAKLLIPIGLLSP